MSPRDQTREDDRPARAFTPNLVGDPRMRKCERHGAYLYPDEFCMGCVSEREAAR